MAPRRNARRRRSRSLRAGEAHSALGLALAAETVRTGLEPPDQHGQVVVVSERFGEIVEAGDQGLQHARGRSLDQPQLVPEGLDRLAPLVQPVVAGLVPGAAKVAAAGPIGAFDAGADRGEPAFDTPVLDELSGCFQQPPRQRDSQVTASNAVGCDGRNFGLGGTDLVEFGVVFVGRPQLVEGRQHGVGVSDRRQRLGSIADELIEVLELVAERTTNQSGDRPNLLAPLANGVDRFLDVGGISIEFVQDVERLVDALARHTSYLVRHPFRRL